MTPKASHTGPPQQRGNVQEGRVLRLLMLLGRDVAHATATCLAGRPRVPPSATQPGLGTLSLDSRCAHSSPQSRHVGFTTELLS